jgi:hypothetical protein
MKSVAEEITMQIEWVKKGGPGHHGVINLHGEEQKETKELLNGRC